MKRGLSLLLILLTAAACSSSFNIKSYEEIYRIPRIYPDYAGTVIPPNIAPMNFAVQEPGKEFLVRLNSSGGEQIEVHSREASIQIPVRKWRKLLNAGRGKSLVIEVYVKKEDSGWQRYQNLTLTVASEEIDSHIAYRVMRPIYSFWESIGIHQRDLTSYRESVIMHGRSFADGCINCHTFLNNDPSRLFIGTRSVKYGSSTLFAEKGKVTKIGAKWGYTAWHPSGRLTVYPAMKVRQFFHAAGMEIRDVVDLDSVMVYYDLEKKETGTNSGFSDKDRLESYPCWSPDGRFLYFCSAAIPWEDRDKLPPDNFDKVKYDLFRIAYDPAADTWGEVETVLSSEETGLSILEPRLSPDGRFLLFCMCDYGCFPIFRPSSDLYMMELATGTYEKLDINSPYSESWHSWSSNGRWIAFSSKRRGGLFTRPFFSYVDRNGKVSKPFILPQKDPFFYDSFLKTYSVPELITGPVKVNRRALARAVMSPQQIKVDTFSGASPAPKTQAHIRE